jgi:hypothetical protein
MLQYKGRDPTATPGIESGSSRVEDGAPVLQGSTRREDGHEPGAGCGEFLARHAEWLDGLVAGRAAAAYARHAAECDACGRYDRVVRDGLLLVRELEPVEPSPDFHARLQHRLFHAEEAAAGARRSPPLAGVMSVAALLALVAWSPILWQRLGPVAPGAAAGGAGIERGAGLTAGGAARVAAEPARAPAAGRAAGVGIAVGNLASAADARTAERATGERPLPAAAGGAGPGGTSGWAALTAWRNAGWAHAPLAEGPLPGWRAVLAELPGPYSPLVVTAPAYLPGPRPLPVSGPTYR